MTPLPENRFPFRVRSCECAPDGVLRVPSLLDWLQETASDHAHALGFDFPVFDEAAGARGAWVLAQLRLRADRLPRWRDEVVVETAPWGVRALSANRDFTVLPAAGGAPFAVASSRWALLDPATRRPVRVPASVAAFEYPHGEPFGPGDPFSRLRPPAPVPGAAEEAPPVLFQARRSDIDLNGHVNNVRYVAWFLETIPEETAAVRRLVALEIAFRAETRLGETVAARTVPDAVLPSDPPGSRAFFHRLAAPDGPDRVLARTVWA